MPKIPNPRPSKMFVVKLQTFFGDNIKFLEVSYCFLCVIVLYYIYQLTNERLLYVFQSTCKYVSAQRFKELI